MGFYVSSMLMVGLVTNLCAMDTTRGARVIFQARDGQAIVMPLEAVQYSKTLSRIVNEYGTAAPIAIDSLDSIKLIFPFINAAYSLKDAPYRTQIETLTNAMVTRPVYKFTDQALLDGLMYLDIDILKDALANAIIRLTHDQNGGDREIIEAIISTLPYPDQFKALLAKFWYLNYGAGQNYILADSDYGFSIEQLRAFNKLPMPQPGFTGLELRIDGLRINDLTGLRMIPGIESVYTLSISHNRLTKLKPGALSALRGMHYLHLNNNLLTRLADGAFSGLNSLVHLNLSHNLLTDVKSGVFKNLINLWDLDLSNNKIKTIEPGILEGLNTLRILQLEGNGLVMTPELRKRFEEFLRVTGHVPAKITM